MRGRLALADIDATADLGPWLDAVYAAFADAPHDVLDKLNREMVVKSAMIDPEEARATWGTLPEHRAMAGNLGRGAGLEAGNANGLPPTRRGTSAPGRPPTPTRHGKR